MTRDEIKREAVKLAAELGMDDEPGMVAYLRVTVARIHAAGLAQGRAEMRERAAAVCDAAAVEERKDIGGECYQAHCATCAHRIRALPDTSEESER